MRNEFTAIIERDEQWFIAYSPEIPGANGQGTTKEEALESLRGAIELILEDRRAGNTADSAWQDRGELRDADKRSLDSALEAYERTPDAGSSWEEVKARLQAKLRRR